jgi:hypothetical protein
MRPSPDPVWILFRRRTYSRVAYWLQVLGFNIHDRSTTNYLYLIYFCIYWLGWTVGVIGILGSGLARLIEFFPDGSPPALAVQSAAVILGAWMLLGIWKVVSRSPFVFSEPDAYLLCQTPASRRKVGLAWFLMDWFKSAIPFAGGTVLLSYALTFLALSGQSNIQNLPVYFAAGFRALTIILPLQMGLLAFLYAVGAWRLRRDRPPGKFPGRLLAALPIGLAFLAVFLSPDWREDDFSLLTFPLQAAFGDAGSQAGWLLPLGVSLLIWALGIAGLLFWSNRMHLGRAAQETRMESEIRLALGVMNFELVELLRSQSTAITSRSPRKFPVGRGIWALIWKNLVQSWHSIRFGQVLRWGFIFLLSLGIFLPSGWPEHLVLGGFWAVFLGGMITNRLRSDLSCWWLTRSLPYPNTQLLLVQLGPASLLGLLLGWLAFVVSGRFTPYNWLTAALLPFLVACASMGSALDILRHAKAHVLLSPSIANENVPRQDIQGILIILITVCIPLAILAWTRSPLDSFGWGWISLPFALVITILLHRLAISAYRWIS